MFMPTSPYLKEHQNGKMGKIGLRDVRPVSQNPLIGFPKTVHKLFKFQEMFFLKQNYRLTIIHSQTLQLSCNLFKLSQETYQLYLSNLSILSILTVKTPQFSPYNSSLNPISFFKLFNTTPKTLHTHPISAHPVQNVSTYVFLSIFSIKNKNQDLNFSRPQVFYSTHY